MAAAVIGRAVAARLVAEAGVVAQRVHQPRLAGGAGHDRLQRIFRERLPGQRADLLLGEVAEPQRLGLDVEGEHQPVLGGGVDAVVAHVAQPAQDDAVLRTLVVAARSCRSTDSRVSPTSESISSISSTSGVASASAQRASTSMSAPSAPSCSSAACRTRFGVSSPRVRRARRASSPSMARIDRAVSSRPAWPTSKLAYTQRQSPASPEFRRCGAPAAPTSCRSGAARAARSSSRIRPRTSKVEQRCDLVVPVDSDRTGSVERAHGRGPLFRARCGCHRALLPTRPLQHR